MTPSQREACAEFVYQLTTRYKPDALEEATARAARATLRQGLREKPGQHMPSHRYVTPLLPDDSGLHDACFLVAALYASHPEHSASMKSMGHTLREVATKVSGAEIQGSSTERRFVFLIDTHREELPVELRHAVSLARSQEVPVNYARLLAAIQDWGWEDKPVQRAWARDFWSPKTMNDSQQAAASSATEGE